MQTRDRLPQGARVYIQYSSFVCLCAECVEAAFFSDKHTIQSRFPSLVHHTAADVRNDSSERVQFEAHSLNRRTKVSHSSVDSSVDEDSGGGGGNVDGRDMRVRSISIRLCCLRSSLFFLLSALPAQPPLDDIVVFLRTHH